jgi:hypothetical protein
VNASREHGSAESRANDAREWLFYAFFALIAVVLVLTGVAYVIFGVPELTVPGRPEPE